MKRTDDLPGGPLSTPDYLRRSGDLLATLAKDCQDLQDVIGALVAASKHHSIVELQALDRLEQTLRDLSATQHAVADAVLEELSCLVEPINGRARLGHVRATLTMGTSDVGHPQPAGDVSLF